MNEMSAMRDSRKKVRGYIYSRFRNRMVFMIAGQMDCKFVQIQCLDCTRTNSRLDNGFRGLDFHWHWKINIALFESSRMGCSIIKRRGDRTS